jgi:hypothetical protein
MQNLILLCLCRPPGRNSPDRYRLMFNHERAHKGVQNEARD